MCTMQVCVCKKYLGICNYQSFISILTSSVLEELYAPPVKRYAPHYASRPVNRKASNDVIYPFLEKMVVRCQPEVIPL